MQVVRSKKYRRGRLRLFALLCVVTLTVAALVFYSPTSDSITSRTQGWVSGAFADFGISTIHDPALKTVIGGGSLVRYQNDDRSIQITAHLLSSEESPKQWLERQYNGSNSEGLEVAGKEAAMITRESGEVIAVVHNQRMLEIVFESVGAQERSDFLELLDLDEKNQNVHKRKDRLISLSDQAFKTLYDSVKLPGTQPITEKPPITGDAAADAKIQEIAEKRGYRLQANASGGLGAADGYSLHESAADAWRDLQASAAKDGISLSVTSGFRDIASQRQIFTSRLATACVQAFEANCSNEKIASGEADAAIDEVLQTSSIPGYSRHHTGHTVDIGHVGVGDFEDFFGTPGWHWVADNNYANAKRFGFIPSYPPDAGTQGPDPEPWEYVFVGPEYFRIGE